MDIFTRYDPKTWRKETVYPYLAMRDPETLDYLPVYSGYDLDEFFKEFDRTHYLDYKVYMMMSASSWVCMGLVKDFVNIKRVCDWQIVKTA